MIEDDLEVIAEHIAGLEAIIEELRSHVDFLMRERTFFIDGKKGLEALGQARIGYEPIRQTED